MRRPFQSGMRSVEDGTPANLEHPVQIDDFMFLRSRQENGLSFAAPSQVVVDLLAGPGRNPQEAVALLDWMRDHEDAWRS
jgi:hypothetical protein